MKREDIEKARTLLKQIDEMKVADITVYPNMSAGSGLMERVQERVYDAWPALKDEIMADLCSQARAIGLEIE